MANFNIIYKPFNEDMEYIVGNLSFDQEQQLWSFNYDQNDFLDAYQKGFRGFQEFPNINETYQSKDLFTVFNNRIYKDERLRNEYISEEQKINLLEQKEAKLYTDNINIKYRKRHTYGKN